MVSVKYPRLTIIVFVAAVSLGVVQVVGQTDQNLQTGSRNDTGNSRNDSGKSTDEIDYEYALKIWNISSYITVVICTIGIISNSLLLVVTYFDPLNNLRRTSWITITNLALADLLTSIATILNCNPIFELLSMETANGTLWVTVFRFFTYASSFFLLLLFAIERYIAVKYPFESSSMVTKKRVFTGCIACWVTAIVLAPLNNFITSYVLEITVAYYGILEITVLVMILLQLLIIRNIKTASRRLVESTNRNARMKKISITIIILILILMVTAFPYFIAKQIELLLLLGLFSGPQSGAMTLKYFSYYYLPIASLNYVINPLIYAWHLSDYRSAFLVLFTRKSLRRETAARSRLVLQKETVSTTAC